ncbi:hypothetical protein GWN26_14800 [Candidatus Saccharibacteria bacterium]|nr:hypothetical protein [Calditrichia bacterium]NIV73046.1 hypothetical protein [Calditrichia bacterium]NIW00313.1 hypothetical protein [Candidatus Saccharibacteria bacterium]
MPTGKIIRYSYRSLGYWIIPVIAVLAFWHPALAGPFSKTIPPLTREMVNETSEKPSQSESPEEDKKDQEQLLIEYLTLRNQGVLLKQGSFQIENSFSYSLNNVSLRLIGDLGSGPELIEQELRDRSWRYDFILRYGLTDELQLSLNVPYVNSEREARVLGAASLTDQTLKFNSDGAGDISLGIRYHAVKERNSGFDLIPFIEGFIPTDFTPDTIFLSADPLISFRQFGFAGGFTFIKPDDPGVLFLTLSGNHFLEKEVENLGNLEAFTLVSYGLGYSLALNYNFAPFFVISGSTYIVDRKVTSFLTSSQTSFDPEVVLLRLGFDYRFSRSFYIEPSFGIGITEDATDFIFTLSIPYQF